MFGTPFIVIRENQQALRERSKISAVCIFISLNICIFVYVLEHILHLRGKRYLNIYIFAYVLEHIWHLRGKSSLDIYFFAYVLEHSEKKNVKKIIVEKFSFPCYLKKKILELSETYTLKKKISKFEANFCLRKKMSNKHKMKL